MKRIIIVVFSLTFCLTVKSQNTNITNENYYEFHTTAQTTSWLSRDEIVPIIIEELEKYNFKWNYKYVLYDLNDTVSILLDVYSKENNFGFIYKTGHYSMPDIKHKINLEYTQTKYNLKGSMVRNKIDLPENIYLLNENLYWYQYNKDENEINDFVCKSKIIEILRNDLRNVLDNYVNLENALEEKKWIEIRPDFESMRKRYANATGIQGFNSQAKFYNGMEGLDKYFQDSTIYPAEARKKKIEGYVIVEYTVNVNGEIENPTIIESSNEIFNDEAIRVVSEMPKWKPALTEKNEKTSMLYKYKISFSLGKN